MSSYEIEVILQKSVKRGWTELRKMVWFYLAVMGSILVVSGMNIAAYRSNPAWVVAHVALTVLVLGFLGFSVHLLGEMRRLDTRAEGLMVLVRRQLSFLRTRYQLWLGVVALGIWLLGFAISTYTYNQDGHHCIHKDIFLGVFVLVQLLAIYGIVRLAHCPLVGRIQAALRDIEAQATEQTVIYERGQKLRIFIGILAVVLGVALLVGILVHLSAR